MQRLLYAITLTWNGREDTVACLTSFQEVKWPPTWRARILVVDNGSTDGTIEAVRKGFPNVETLPNKINLGFARGANEGIRYALEQGAEAVFLFNNDTLFDPFLGNALADALDSLEKNVAAISPTIFYAENPSKIWSVGGGRNKWTLEITGNHGRDLLTLPKQPFEQEVLTGCALLFPRRALQYIGLFDEQFFMYYEDSDWSLRARSAGWRLMVVPQAHMWHKEAESSGGLGSPAERYHVGRASVQFFRKYTQGIRWFIVFPYRLASAIKTSLRLAYHGQFASISSYWRGIWDGLKVDVSHTGINCQLVQPLFGEPENCSSSKYNQNNVV